jgi:hypothetical protein
MKMNKRSTTFVATFTLLVLFLTVSCNKNEDPVIVQPPDPELIGTWQGTTSQGQLIRVGVFNLDGLLIINTYKYDVLLWETDTTYRVKSYDFNLSTIVTSVVDKQFAFNPQGSYTTSDYLTGIFDVAAMKLTGKFKTSFPNTSGTNAYWVTGTYTCTKLSGSPQ